MKERIKLTKSVLKSLAKEIKFQKSIRKPSNKKHAQYRGHGDLSHKFRHLHVAYCLLRGRSIEQIDSGKDLDMKYVEWFKEIIQDESKAKLYVVVCEDLSPAVKAVQGIHAVAEFMKKNKDKTLWNNGTVVLLQARTPHVSYGNSDYANFREPDMNNRHTASASFGPSCGEFYRTRNGFTLM